MSEQIQSTESTATSTTQTSQPAAGTSALASNLAEAAKGQEATKISNAATYQEHAADKLSNVPGKDETKPDIKQTATEEAEYDLELPKDSILTAADLEEVVKLAEEQNLNKVQAEKLLKSREELLKKGMSQAEIKLQEKYKAEKKELESHPEFVGEKKVKSFESINRAISTFGDEGLIKALNRADIGNNVHLALFFKKIGDMIASDSIEGKGTSAASSQGTENKEATLAKLYPGFFENK